MKVSKDTGNSTPNGTTHKNIHKNDKNIYINSESQNCDIGGGSDQTAIIQELIEEMKDLKERLDAQDSRTARKKQVNPLITKGREVFEKKYGDLFDGSSYYWQAKDAVAMGSLTKKIIHSRKQKGMSVEDDDVISGLVAFLDSITDTWLLKNFSVTNISSKYNEIVAQAKAKHNANGTNRQGDSAKQRADEAASIIARLAKEDDAGQ